MFGDIFNKPEVKRMTTRKITLKEDQVPVERSEPFKLMQKVDLAHQS
jgi:hypothetical protein